MFAFWASTVHAFSFFLHILHQTAQTEVYTENQQPRFHGSGSNNLGRADRQADTGRYREAPPLKSQVIYFSPVIKEWVCGGASVAHGQKLFIVMVWLGFHHQ